MPTDRPTIRRAVQVPADGVELAGDLVVPPAARGVVLFAHGRGSSRHSPRNQQVATALHNARFGTLVMDPLTEAEEEVDVRTRELRFDIGLLTGRLTDAADWLGGTDGAPGLALATFGGSTGGPLRSSPPPTGRMRNRDAAARLAAEHDLAVVAGATHLFPEPGALDQVIERTVDWLDR
jgi:putative phosphoribosyl transferase